MATTKTGWKTKKSSVSKASKREAVSGVVAKKNVSSCHDSDVSVFTKTTGPKVVVQSENVQSSDMCTSQNIRKHRILKSVFMIVMGIIILMTFFLSLKTYNAVNELYQLFNY